MIGLDWVIDSTILYAFVWSLIHSLWQGPLAAISLFIALKIIPRSNANIRYFACLVALVFFTSIFVLTFIQCGLNASNAIQAVDASSPIYLNYSGSIWERFFRFFNSKLDIGLIFWFFGFVYHLYRMCNDYRRGHQLRNRCVRPIPLEWQRCFQGLAERMGLKRVVEFRESRAVTSLCVIGHWKPVVLIPFCMLSGLRPDQVEALIFHELAHIKRNDYLINFLQSSIKVIFFFNPAVIWVHHQIDRERENACDDEAVRCCGDARVFALGLTEMSELELRLDSVMAIKKRGWRLFPRVQRLFEKAHSTAHPVEYFVTFFLLVVVAVGVNVQAADRLKQASMSDEVLASKTEVAVAPRVKRFDYDSLLRRYMAEVEAIGLAEQAPSSTPKKVVLPTSELEPESDVPMQPLRADFKSKNSLPALPELDYALNHSREIFPESVQLANSDGFKRPSGLDVDQFAIEPEPISMERFETLDFENLSIATTINVLHSKKIYIRPAEVEFSNSWLKRYSAKTSSKYKNEVRQSYSESLTQEISSALEESGWNVLDSPSTDCVTVSLALLDLYISVPGGAGTQTLATYAGRASYSLSITAANGNPIMQASDQRSVVTGMSGSGVVNRSTNFFLFHRLMSAWSSATVLYFSMVMDVVEASAEEQRLAQDKAGSNVEGV